MRRLTSSVLDSIERGIENHGIALFQDARSLLHECRLLRQERDAAEGLLSDMAADGGMAMAAAAERRLVLDAIKGYMRRNSKKKWHASNFELEVLGARGWIREPLPIQQLRAENEFLRDTLAKVLERFEQKWPTSAEGNLSEALALREAGVIHLIERALSEGKP